MGRLARAWLRGKLGLKASYSGGKVCSVGRAGYKHTVDINREMLQQGEIARADFLRIQLQMLQYPGQPAYQKTNQAFIDEWENAIDLYGQIFSGITLVATTDNGFPNFTGATVTIPPAFAAD